MSQKTIYTADEFKVGDEVLLVGRQLEASSKEEFYIYKQYAKTGYPGNQNREIKRFHGWRGTTNGMRVYAYGVRVIESVEKTAKTDEYGNEIYKVRVGKDIHPDYE